MNFSVEMLMTELSALYSQALEIWLAGGWAMVMIALVALMIFGLGMNVQMKLMGKGFRSVPEKTWRRWIDHPGDRRGPVGELLDFVTGAKTIQETGVLFEELRKVEVAPFERDLRVMKIGVSAAPLFGLLGTVTGMLATFEALASGSGGDKTMAMIAAGISEALVTTETGLVIALPGLFFQYQLARKLERYKMFLAHLETVCTQRMYKKLREKRHEPEVVTFEPSGISKDEKTGSGNGNGGNKHDKDRNDLEVAVEV